VTISGCGAIHPYPGPLFLSPAATSFIDGACERSCGSYRYCLAADVASSGHAVPNDLTSLEGTALEERNVRHVFTRMLEKAELRRIRVHDLRHTFASLLLQQGESVVYVKEQLGHGSVQITVDTYGHLIPGANRAAVDRLDDDVPA